MMRVAFGLALALLAGVALAQSLPLKPTRRIQFETNEGTWMSLDVSRDDRQLVFDLLGDLYRLDANGGRAGEVSDGCVDLNAAPARSPDRASHHVG